MLSPTKVVNMKRTAKSKASSSPQQFQYPAASVNILKDFIKQSFPTPLEQNTQPLLLKFNSKTTDVSSQVLKSVPVTGESISHPYKENTKSLSSQGEKKRTSSAVTNFKSTVKKYASTSMNRPNAATIAISNNNNTLRPESADKQGKGHSRKLMNTKVVLSPSPNFGTEKSDSNIANGRKGGKRKRHLKNTADVSAIPSFSQCEDYITLSAEDKAHWVQMVVDKMGKRWMNDGRIPSWVITSPAFREKLGVYYESAMQRKHYQIQDLVKAVAKDSDARDTEKHLKQSQVPVPAELAQEVQRKISDILLQMLLQTPSTGAGWNTGTPSTQTGSIQSTKTTPSPGTASVEIISSSTGLSFKKAYIFNGKIFVVDKLTVNDLINSFAPVSSSRKKTSPKDTGYFRKIANLSGFQDVDISFKCDESSIIVEANRPQRGDDNARYVNETILLPKRISSDGLKRLTVMRTRKGLIIFEEDKE